MKPNIDTRSFYKHLEIIAESKKRVTIIFLDSHNSQTMINDLITHIEKRGNEKFVILHTGWEIPIEKVISAGQKSLSDFITK